VLVIAHRRELIAQAHGRLLDQTGELIGIEQAEQRSHGERIVVASRDTLHPDRLREVFKPGDVATIFVDEAHHAAKKNKTYTHIFDYLSKAQIIGFTATPDRQDESALAQTFDAVCEPYEILEGIEDGYLCPFVGATERLPSLSLAGMTRNGPGGDYGDKQLGEELLRNQETMKAIVGHIIDYAGDSRKTLGFFPTVETAHIAAEALNVLRPGFARAVDGTTPMDERDRAVRAYRDGDLQGLMNCGVFTEGSDFPKTSLVALARPTRSRGLYAQMAGRGGRLSPGKADCILLDFVGVTDDKSLCCPEELLGGRYDEEVLEEAKKKKGGKTHEKLAAAAMSVAKRKAEAAAIARAKAARTASGSFDPFKALGIREPSAAMARFAAPPSEKQVAMIIKAGWTKEAAEKLSRQQCSAIISKLMDRMDRKLATLPMVRAFSKRGIDAKNASFANARQAMDFLASNNWRASNADVEAILFRQRQPGEDA
jgi:superfamily II DNA or RNA helicase